MKSLRSKILVVAIALAVVGTAEAAKLRFRFLSGNETAEIKYELRVFWLTNTEVEKMDLERPPWRLAGTLKCEQSVEVPAALLNHQRGISIKAEVFETKSGRKVGEFSSLPANGTRSFSSFFQGAELLETPATGVITFIHNGPDDRVWKEFEWKENALW